MAENSAIEWCDATWNPVTGCSKVSPGCAHCYIERTPPFRIADRKFVRGTTDVVIHEDRLDWPLRRRKPQRVFVNSLSDLFHRDVDDDFVAQVFGVMAAAPHHIFLVLTKRPERMRDLLSREDFGELAAKSAAWAVRDNIGAAMMYGLVKWTMPLQNVWLGVSVENQRWADERIPLLLETPAAVRFISAEPLLGPVNVHMPPCLCDACEPYPDARIDWLICGGESGPKARPFDVAWARSLRDQCANAGIAFFMKQLGGRRPGSQLEELPADLQIRDFPRRGGA